MLVWRARWRLAGGWIVGARRARTPPVMPLLVKICGLKTPDALDAALDAGADMVGFVFFPPSPRHLGFEAARALGERVQGPRQKGRAVGRCRRRRARARGRGAQARHAAAARQGDAGARRRGALALRPAGDEGAADRDASRSRADPASTPRSPTGCCSTRARRARRRGPAGSARPSTGSCWKTSIPACRSCSPAGSMPATSPRRCAITRAPAVDVSSGVERAPGEKDPDKIRAFIRAARDGRAARCAAESRRARA